MNLHENAYFAAAKREFEVKHTVNETCKAIFSKSNVLNHWFSDLFEPTSSRLTT